MDTLFILAVGAAGVVFGAEKRDVMPPGELATEFGGVDFGAGAVAWQEVVNGL